jgi:hypothetical protein
MVDGNAGELAALIGRVAGRSSVTAPRRSGVSHTAMAM